MRHDQTIEKKVANLYKYRLVGQKAFSFRHQPRQIAGTLFKSTQEKQAAAEPAPAQRL
jgi:hypothetical protein